MKNPNESIEELRIQMRALLSELDWLSIKPRTPAAPRKPAPPVPSTPESPKALSDVMIYGIAIYGVCAAVLICLSQTSLIRELLAPGALGVFIGLGLVAADQLSFRAKIARVCNCLRG